MPGSSRLQLFKAAELTGELRKGTLVLDTRPAEQFARLHIRGSVQISLMGSFAAWAAILIHPTQKVLLIAEDARWAQEAYNRMVRVGLEHVIGYAVANEKEWRYAAIELASISIHRCANLVPVSSFQLIDVRSRAEWLKGHLPGAISIPLLDLDAETLHVDPSKPSLVYCHEGYRATTAASILLRDSAAKIGILIDGIEGWSASGLPLEMPVSK